MSSQRKFHFVLVPSIAYALLMILLLSLGKWQLQRADEKQVLFDAFSSGSSALISIDKALELDEPRYQHVQLIGHFELESQYLLDNMVNSESVPGSQVYTPFRVENGPLLIVNRGWIARRSTAEPRESLQGFLDVPSEKISISGRLDTLRQPGLVLEAEIPDGDYPKTVQFPTFAQLETDLGERLVPYQLLLDADESDTIGFLREWKPHEMGPERHLGYALQWFALALTLTIIYLVVSFRKVAPKEVSPNNSTDINSDIAPSEAQSE